MAIGPGKYDDLCTYAREQAKAAGAALIIVEGERGMGFSVQMAPNHLMQMPNVLRKMASDIEAALSAPLEELKKAVAPDGTHKWCEACQSWHVPPKTIEEHTALKCKKPWEPPKYTAQYSVPRPDLAIAAKAPKGIKVQSCTDEAKRGITIRAGLFHSVDDTGEKFVPFVSGPGQMFEAEIKAVREILQDLNDASVRRNQEKPEKPEKEEK